MDEFYWGGYVSLDGQVRYLTQKVSLETARADKAEAKLRDVETIVTHWSKQNEECERGGMPTQVISIPWIARRIMQAIK
ncbi:hypothetical protein [Mycolicibacterium palauense]|uniref:hypothetical protein n=1 Tax=Mycolicibacterium palauense TaxID=2034511 RepID=UPI000BFEF73C|nr:hypothetical protein [Mycolicibacterium palauense]